MKHGENGPKICQKDLSTTIKVFGSLTAFDMLHFDSDFSPGGLLERIQTAQKGLWEAAHGDTDYPDGGSTIVTVVPKGHKRYRRFSLEDDRSTIAATLTVVGNYQDEIIVSKINPGAFTIPGIIPTSFLPEEDFFYPDYSAASRENVSSLVAGVVLLGVIQDATKVVQRDPSTVLQAAVVEC